MRSITRLNIQLTGVLIAMFAPSKLKVMLNSNMTRWIRALSGCTVIHIWDLLVKHLVTGGLMVLDYLRGWCSIILSSAETLVLFIEGCHSTFWVG
jgi:hypothetical protein